MGYRWLLLGFDGRINRARLWLASVIMLGGMILLSALTVGIGNLLGLSVTSFSIGTGDIFTVLDPATYRSSSSIDRFALLVQVAATPVFLWSYLAFSVKRLHDLDQSGWWMIPFFVIPGLHRQFGSWLGDSKPAIVLNIIIIVVAVWGALELYGRKGTSGDNRFGADLLAATNAVDSTLAWDQQSELEFVPHKAGPSPGPHVNRRA
jgi:uncharacterized membrane protein YhaH (DUF805 family)